MEVVSVEHEYEYTTKSGRLVAIKPDESFLLVARTNEHWWHVRKDLDSKPFYVPAQYMKRSQLDKENAQDPRFPDGRDDKSLKEKNTLLPVKKSSGEKYRFSSFGLCAPEDNPVEQIPQTDSSGFAHKLTESCVDSDNSDFCLYAIPQSKLKGHKQSKNCGNKDVKLQLRTFECQVETIEEDSFEFPPPPTPTLFPKDGLPTFNQESDTKPGSNEAQIDGITKKKQSENQMEKKRRPPLRKKVDNDLSAVYVNVAQVRKSISDSPPSAPSSFSPSCLDPEGWEVHFDQDSGQDYYYHPATGHTTWDNPFTDSSPSELKPCSYSPSPPPSPPLSPATPSSDWEELVDERSGQTYFYNPMSGETSWDPPVMEPMSVHRFHEDGPPPLPEEDYPQEDYPAVDPPEQYEDFVSAGPSPTQEFSLSHVTRTVIPRASLDRSTPSGWNLSVEPNGTWVFTNECTTEQWIKSVDEQGQTYYYLRGGSVSLWTLPEARLPPGLSRVENGGHEVENTNVIKNWRHSMGPATLSPIQDDGRFVPTHKRTTSDYGSDTSSTGNSPEIQHNVQNLEKAGILNKTKICENGKKVRKNWAQTWTVLQHGLLTFHKDPKSAATGASNKTNQIVPEIQVDLRGASINWASKDKSSKKNVLELKSKNGVEFLIQYDTESIISDWHKALGDTIRQLGYQEHQSEEEDNDVCENISNLPNIDDKQVLPDKRRPSRNSVTHTSSNAADADQKRVRTKLMKFLLKRPTLQSVKEKGYIRDNVFGCPLATLCCLEKNSVPSFVEKCIKAVERRGLDIDGLYRVSGNLAVIQKLRFKADHEELDLEDGQWEDVHVITGALKLFFRELPEPLFPFSHFNKFIEAIRQADYNTKLSYICNLVKSLPQPNHDTMKLLFEHLCNVINCGEDNRMTVQNVAIVFGPTLLRPENESSNLTLHMVYQNQIVEFILNEYEQIFL
ncbi:rho GTPase-activating protein 27 [Eucyclogobius newberryi]|uniref:rho GTPase-activating protein 27 n=1 Tax=Eucyclogobius newberryi TaxID=166745 RepID=UPI003B5C5AD1